MLRRTPINAAKGLVFLQFGINCLGSGFYNRWKSGEVREVSSANTLADQMHLRESRKRPASWAEYKRSIGHGWSTPWYGVELAFEWLAYFLGRWAFLEVLEYSGTFSVLIAVVFYCADTGNRRKQNTIRPGK